ncbi:MAG: hypothetical protein WCP85_15195 [Mariniphaga sp.]
MSKLYIFGIGGTGSRVLKSLTMLLAAGVDCGVKTIVPIIIDRDTSNQDLTRTELLIKDYIVVNKIAERTKENKFFKTKIELLNNKLLLPLKGDTKTFKDYIGRNETMNLENQALVDMLFSNETLDMDMTVGFQGNPNIGSVVLNQFDDNDIFKAFSNDFTDEDSKIFIVSSIFGGTGASGFPLLLKELHNKKENAEKLGLSNWSKINKAKIGALSVLPYFNVKCSTDNSLVNSDTFHDKAKAALTYYLTLNKQLDTLYYIGDNTPSTFEHNKGGEAQQNNAHFVELASALAILDFVNPEKENENYHSVSDEPTKVCRNKTTYGEFGINFGQDGSCNIIDFSNFETTKRQLVEPLSRFLLFRNYMTYVFDKQYNYQPYGYRIGRPAKSLRNKEVIKKMVEVQAKFYEWLNEMQSDQHNRKFIPFSLSTTNAFDFVLGNTNVIAKPSWSDNIGYKDWARIDNELNRQKIKEKFEQEELFLELFYRTTSNLIKL